MKNQISNKFKSKIPFDDNNFRKIVTFFLFECPVPNVSSRGKTLAEYGWDQRSKLCSLVRLLKNNATKDFRDNYLCYKSKEECIKNIGTLSNKASLKEYCMFLGTDDKNRIQSLLKSIRNAFAHGSFEINSKKKYHFENFDKYLKADILLSEKTLLKWIRTIKNEASC